MASVEDLFPSSSSPVPLPALARVPSFAPSAGSSALSPLPPADGDERPQIPARQRAAEASAAAAAPHAQSLLPHERLALSKEQRVRALWARRTAEWERFRGAMSRKLQRPDAQLVVAHSDEFRARREELDALDLARGEVQERASADDWRASLRAGAGGAAGGDAGAHYVLIGNAFTGIWAAVKERRPGDVKFETVRRKPRIRPPQPAAADTVEWDAFDVDGASKPVLPEHTDGENIGDSALISAPALLRGAGSWIEAPELQRKRELYAPQLAVIRQHELQGEDAAELVASGEPLFEWAQRSAGVDPGLLQGSRLRKAFAPGPRSTDPQAASSGPSVDMGKRKGVDGNAILGVGEPARTQVFDGYLVQQGTQLSLPEAGHNLSDSDNEAVIARQLDLSRAALIAVNEWRGVAPASHGADALAAAHSVNSLVTGSFRGSVSTPHGSSASVHAGGIVRLSSELQRGPHLHVQVVLDAATGLSDIGASVGTTGRLQPIRGVMSSHESAAAVAAAIAGGAGAPGGGQGGLGPMPVDFHPSWANSLVLGRSTVANLEGGNSSNRTRARPHQVASESAMHTAPGWPEVAFESSVGAHEPASARLRLANTGSTILYFRWLPLIAPSFASCSKIASKASSAPRGGLHLDATLPLNEAAERFSGSVYDASSDGSVPSPHVPSASAAASGPRFVCSRTAGSILPGACADILFTFEAHSPGVYTEQWELTSSPAANGPAPILITLRGVAAATDETGPRRARLEGRIRIAASFSVAREVLYAVIDSLELELPSPLPRDEKVTTDERRFLRANPGLFYHEDVYNSLESEVAQPAFVFLGVRPRARVWSGSIEQLAGLLGRIEPQPETASEREEREEEERAASARAEAAEAQRREAAERAAAEAAAAEAAAAEAASVSKGRGGGAAKPGSAAGARRSSISPLPSVPLANSASSAIVPLPFVSQAAEKRAQRAALYASLSARLAELVVASSRCPLSQHPLYAPCRAIICELAELLPFAAGGVREAEKQELVSHSPRDRSLLTDSSDATSGESWVDAIPLDSSHADLLRIIYGRNGRPPPRVRAMRPKLGRDGEYHPVPVDPDDGFDNPQPEDEDEEVEGEKDHYEDPDPDDFAFRESWRAFERRLAVDAAASRDALNFTRQAEARAAADVAAAASSAASIAAQIDVVAKGKVGGKLGAPAKDLSLQAPRAPESAAASPVRGAPLLSSDALAAHPLAKLVPRVPVDAFLSLSASPGDESVSPSGEEYAFLSRFAFVTKRLVGRALSALGTAAVLADQSAQNNSRARQHMLLSRKLAIDNVEVGGRIALVRADFDLLPNSLLRAAVSGENQEEAVALLASHDRVVGALPTVRSLQVRGARLVILASAQGSSRPPYLDDVASGRGQPVPAWPRVSGAQSDAGALGTCESFVTALPHAGLVPINRDSGGQLDSSIHIEGVEGGGKDDDGGENMAAEEAAIASASAVSQRPDSSTISIVQTFSSSSFVGLAAALSRCLPPATPLVFSKLTDLCSPRVWIAGEEVGIGENNLHSTIIGAPLTSGTKAAASSFLDTLRSCAETASDFAEFSRLLASFPATPPGTVILLENLLHPDTYAAEVGTRRVFGLTRQMQHLPFGCRSAVLDSRFVRDWSFHHVALWLQGLCPGVEHEEAWRQYVASFSAARVDGCALLSWLRSNEDTVEPTSSILLGAASSLSLKLRRTLNGLGLAPLHISSVESALSLLMARIEAEGIATQRVCSIDLWAKGQADLAGAAMRGAADELAATMRIQSLLRGHVARRRAAIKRGRELSRSQAGGRARQKADTKRRQTSTGTAQLKLLSAGGAAADSDIAKSAASATSVRFAAFSTELTAEAFSSKAARGQAAVRGVLSACCDVFVQDSLLACGSETASATGVRPSRAAVLQLQKGVGKEEAVTSDKVVAEEADSASGTTNITCKQLPSRGGLRVMGLALAREVRSLGALVQSFPHAAEAQAPRRHGPVLSILGGGPDLRAKVASLETLILCSDAVALAGAIGWAWLAHTGPAWSSAAADLVEDSSLGGASPSFVSITTARASAQFGLTPFQCAAWEAVGGDLRRLAALAERRGVRILAPQDAVVASTSPQQPAFDPRLCNPIDAVAIDENGATLAATSHERLARFLLPTHMKLLADSPVEAIEEDDVPDEEYDSDNSDDMEALRARNQRRRARAAAAASLRIKRRDAAAARFASRPSLPDELSADFGPSLVSTAGLCLPMPPPFHKRGEPFFTLPDSESAMFEWEWEQETHVVDLARGDSFGPFETAIDIGPATSEALLEACSTAGTVLLHGPLGVVEIADGASATLELLATLDGMGKCERGGAEGNVDGDSGELPAADVFLVGGALAAFARRCGCGLAGASLVSESGAVLLCNKVVPGIALLSESAPK